MRLRAELVRRTKGNIWSSNGDRRVLEPSDPHLFAVSCPADEADARSGSERLQASLGRKHTRLNDCTHAQHFLSWVRRGPLFQRLARLRLQYRCYSVLSLVGGNRDAQHRKFDAQKTDVADACCRQTNQRVPIIGGKTKLGGTRV